MPGFSRFGKTWANKGAVSAPNDQQFDTGFSFLGNTPPSVELFNGMFQERDEQTNWLFSQLSFVMRKAGITPAPTPDTQLYDAMAGVFGVGGVTANPGWIALSPSITLQWSTLTIAPLSTRWTFPIAFDVTCFGVVATAFVTLTEMQADVASVKEPVVCSSLSSTSAVLDFRDSISTFRAFAMAIGA